MRREQKSNKTTFPPPPPNVFSDDPIPYSSLLISSSNRTVRNTTRYTTSHSVQIECHSSCSSFDHPLFALPQPQRYSSLSTSSLLPLILPPLPRTITSIESLEPLRQDGKDGSLSDRVSSRAKQWTNGRTMDDGGIWIQQSDTLWVRDQNAIRFAGLLWSVIVAETTTQTRLGEGERPLVISSDLHSTFPSYLDQIETRIHSNLQDTLWWIKSGGRLAYHCEGSATSFPFSLSTHPLSLFKQVSLPSLFPISPFI